jgi:pyruvate ferredoxin oxidoreductase alpha subunit
MERIGLEGSIAIAEAVRLADVDVVAAYPITPQTHIVERLAEYVANGKLNANYIPVESEHSAMSACLGSSAVGARTFTATAGLHHRGCQSLWL